MGYFRTHTHTARVDRTRPAPDLRRCAATTAGRAGAGQSGRADADGGRTVAGNGVLQSVGILFAVKYRVGLSRLVFLTHITTT